MTPDWIVRVPTDSELPRLAEIERLAGARFDDIPALADVSEVLIPPGALAAALARGQVWAAVASADATPVGFAYATVVDDSNYLEELDVLPAWGRRGIGRALVEAVVADARARDLRAVTLTTFRDVPWNAPFYETLGFRIVDLGRVGPGLAAVWAHERARGLPPALRVVMRRELDR